MDEQHGTPAGSEPDNASEHVSALCEAVSGQPCDGPGRARLAARAAPLLSPSPHSVFEDVQGLMVASVISSLGLAMFGANGLMTGGTAGMAFLLHYATGIRFGLAFFLINLPFYVFALRKMGWVFTLKTFISVTLLGVLVDLMPHFIVFRSVEPLYSSIAGGVLLGIGILAFIRHRSSLGGVNILAIWLQQAHGMRAGRIQMLLDVLILAGAFFVLPLDRVAYSILGAVVLGTVLALNHKPGRYMGF